MANLQTLLTSLQAGDFDAVLKGTEYDWTADETYIASPPHVLMKGFYGSTAGRIVKDCQKNAATAHVLTLLVGEMVRLWNNPTDDGSPWLPQYEELVRQAKTIPEVAALLKQEAV